MTLLALKGAPVGPLIAPAPTEDAALVPERPPLRVRLEESRLLRLRRLVPRPLRGAVRRLLGAETRHH